MAGQEIMNNGKEIYTYMSDVNEVNVTSFDPSADNVFSPSNIYNIYKKGYKYTFKGESKVGNQVYETVELIPTKSNNNISKVQIKVNKRDKSIKSWKIWDDRGRATNFNIT
ncbi:MAG: outer membrane lipoprotein carrier protein LolA, partial [Spirosomataceae bacterium]